MIYLNFELIAQLYLTNTTITVFWIVFFFFKFVILVAKHHDGFYIWPSFKWRENMKKLGKSYDAVEEFSKSCTKYDIPMGLYLSPWDLNSENYGKAEDNYRPYNDYMTNQLVELLYNQSTETKGESQRSGMMEQSSALFWRHKYIIMKSGSTTSKLLSQDILSTVDTNQEWEY